MTSLNSRMAVSMIAPLTSSTVSSGTILCTDSADSSGLDFTYSIDFLKALTKRLATSGRSAMNLSDASSDAE
ncbi:hypothetical protein D3C87_1879140 [compost metagenome]